MKYFASRIAQRVIGSLVLAAIFGVISNCARATTQTQTWETAKSTMTFTVSVTKQTALVPRSGSNVAWRYDVTGTFTIVKKEGQPSVNGTYAVITRTAMSFSPGGGDGGAYNLNWTHNQPGGTAWLGSHISTVNGYILSSQSSPNPYNVLSTVAWEAKSEQDNSDAGHILTFTDFSPSAPPSKTLTLTHTNTGTEWEWAGWAAVGETWVSELDYVGPGATKTWKIQLESTDTKQYEVRVVSSAAWGAHGAVEQAYETGSAEDKAGDNMYDFGDLAKPVGTPKGYADAGALETSTAPSTPPPSSTTPPPPLKSATPYTVPTGTSGAASAVAPVAPVVPSAPTAAPTQQSSADGVNAIVKALNGLTGQVAGVQSAVKNAGGVYGGGGTDMSGVESRLDTANAKLEELRTRDKERADRQKEIDDDVPTAADAAAKGTAAGDAAKGVINSKGGSAPTGLGYSPSTGGDYASALVVQFPAAFGGATINLNPFSNSGLLTVAHWFRGAVQWLAYALLGVFVWTELKSLVASSGVARQATGNTVFAGTGAQVTALGNAGLITVAVAVLLVAAMAWSFDSVSLSFLRSNALTNPLAGMPSAALGMLSELLPVATLITCVIARYTFNFYSTGLLALYNGVVRFFIA